MRYLTAILFITLIFSGCAAFKSPNYNSIEIGMSKDQVIKRLGNKHTIISAKKYDDGILEIYQFLNVGSAYATSSAAYNWLFFFNNELDEWGPRDSYIPFDKNIDYRKKRNNR